MTTRRAVLPVLIVAAVHFALTAYSLLASLYFTVLGEPGFDPLAAETAAILGRWVGVLGFPILPILVRFPTSPLVDGLAAWFWLGLNSLLWGIALVSVWRAIRRRLERGSPRTLDAA